MVDQIECRDYDATYVDQTGRKLKTRLAEHRNHIRRVTSTCSVITDHKVSCNHDFDWDNVRILESERNYNKRMSEMLYINGPCKLTLRIKSWIYRNSQQL